MSGYVCLVRLNNDFPVVRLELSQRATNALHKAGFKTAGSINGMSISELTTIPNIGRRTAYEIIDTIDSLEEGLRCNSHPIAGMTYEELIDWVAGRIMVGLIKGEFRDSVYVTLSAVLENWRRPNE